jgi:carbon storage regulator CsrA
MLVISRTAVDGKDTFTVDGPARIILVRTKGNQVQIGIEAPRSTTILREGVVDKYADPKQQPKKKTLEELKREGARNAEVNRLRRREDKFFRWD